MFNIATAGIVKVVFVATVAKKAAAANAAKAIADVSMGAAAA